MHRFRTVLYTSWLALLALPARAQLENPLQAESLEELLTQILQGIVQLGAIVLVVALVWVGFLFVMAQGNEQKIKDARAALMWVVIGGLVLLGAESISLVIQATVSEL